jgi:polyisoprenyl-teichoic acid--peptidoglycan teichoic acid transferase
VAAMQRSRAPWASILILAGGLVALVLFIHAGASARMRALPTATTIAQQLPAATVTATRTARSSPTALPPTYTAAAPEPTPTASDTALPTSSPTLTPLPSATPSPTQTVTPTPYATLINTDYFPTAVPTFARPPHVTNIALLGNDAPIAANGHTDSIILVSLDHDLRTATMLSLPRDIYLPIPGYQMARINTAMPYGSVADYPGAGGGMFKDTIAYNFGIPVDYYIRVGFDGFKQVVDLLGGVTVPVTCRLRDWRLIEPDLDPQVEENWEMFTLDTGIHHMDGDTALWYVRSRRSSSDFDRGRRQQQVLRAIFNRGLDRDFIARLPDLWEAYQAHVQTDMTLPLLLQLAAMAPDVRENGIQHLYLPPAALRAWTTPAGGAVQLLQWEAAQPVLARLMQPPLLNHANRPPITVEVVSPFEFTYQLAAEMLAWYGFAPVRGEATGEMPSRTEVTYFGANRKGSFDWLLGWLVNVRPENIILEPDSGASTYDYRVVLGYNYDSCRPEREIPSPP